MVSLQGVLDLLLSGLGTQLVIRRMRILSPYHRHFNLVPRFSDGIYPQLNPSGDIVISNAVGAISSCQGMEKELIIFPAGRGPSDTQPLGQESLLDSLRDMYVMAKRA